MDTKTFFTRVLAQPDDVVICTLTTDPHDPEASPRFWNRGSFSDIDAAVSAVSAWDSEPNTTVYFSVGKHAGHGYVDQRGWQKWRRLQETATWFRAFALDLDTGQGKPYPDQRAGWSALHAAVQVIGLPVPMVVSSGNGIHCYWPLDTDIPRDRWEVMSVALRLALADQGVLLDTTKVHDPSMVLRPVGTHHKKQAPWKTVTCMHDAGPFSLDIVAALRPWADAARKFVATKSRAKPRPGRQSSITSAVLNSNDVDVALVATHCAQVAALVASGGVTDAAGAPVLEPMWRASLGLAKHGLDVPAAVVMLAGKHPAFDLQDSLNKLTGWRGSGPTTCLTFEQHCASGCDGCPHRGKVKSPAQLSFARAQELPEQAQQASNGGTGTPTPPDELSAVPEPPSIELPPGYCLARVARPYMHVCREDIADDDAGTMKLLPVAPYEMYVTAVYVDPGRHRSTAAVLVNYPHEGWKEFDMPLEVLATSGKEFIAFLLGKLIVVDTVAGGNEIRRYLMRFIDFVQGQAAPGADFDAFGWQEDGSFLCGSTLLGSPTGNSARRLSGPAKQIGDHIMAEGDRAVWVDAMRMLDDPSANNIAAATLLGTAGILGKYSGNSSFLVSIYSTQTTTGKSLALAAVNSLIGRHRDLLLGERDTANAVYKMRGVLNQLPATIDELTLHDPEEAVALAYNLSQGREKLAMDRNRDLRKPVTWDGPTIVSTNHSLHQKYDEFMAQADPVKARTLELHQHDRDFIQGMDGKRGTVFFQMLEANHGFAYPELVQGVLDMGGPKAVWDAGERKFEEKYRFLFEPQERFYRSAIISAWIMGRLGRGLGLFPFDIDRVIEYLCKQVKKYRDKAEQERADAFDIIGQFLQEHNDRLVVCREQYVTPPAKGNENVQFPVPDLAVARIKVVYDTSNPVMPGSQLAINTARLREWLRKTRDSIDRVVDELLVEGALISARDRVTIYKGCQRENPGQAMCVIINLTHPRFMDALTATKARPGTGVVMSILHGRKA